MPFIVGDLVGRPDGGAPLCGVLIGIAAGVAAVIHGPGLEIALVPVDDLMHINCRDNLTFAEPEAAACLPHDVNVIIRAVDRHVARIVATQSTRLD